MNAPASLGPCCAQIKMVDVQTVVLDEVDVMFLDETFDLTAIGTAAPSGTQFVFVTATLPVAVADQVRWGGLGGFGWRGWSSALQLLRYP